MAEIDNLEIVLSASVDNATKRLTTLASRMTALSGVAKSATSGFSDFATKLKDIGKNGAITAIASIPKYFGGQLIGNLKKSTEGLGNFFKSMKRIAMYRLFRYIIRSITQAFKEGTKNLYHWSESVNGKFVKSMDMIATSSKYLKNSLGAMVSPLLEQLAPAIDYIVDKFVAMFNYVNQLLARLSGATTYTAAKKVAAKWDDASKSASKTAKDLKRTILAFDEINKLNDQSNGSGSSNKDNTDYSNMFETRTIEGAISTFADKLKEAFTNGDWETLGKTLGEKVNEIVGKVDFAGMGKKVGNAINAWFTTKYWTLDTINFTQIGKDIAAFLNNAIATADFGMIGRTMVKRLTSLFDAGIGLFLDFDFGEMAKKVSQFIIGIFNELTRWINKQDWEAIGSTIWESIVDTTKNTDFAGIIEAIAKFFLALTKASNTLIFGFLEGIWGSVKQWWNKSIVGNSWEQTVSNLFTVIAKAVTGYGVVKWVITNIISPIIKALIGEDNWKKVSAVADNIWKWIEDKWKLLPTILTVAFGVVKNAATTVWNELQKFWGDPKGYVLGVWAKIKSNAKEVWLDLYKNWGPAIDWVLGVWAEIKTNASTIFNELSSAWGSAKNWVIGIWASITRTANSIWNEFEEFWGDPKGYVLGVWSKIKTLPGTIWNELYSAWGSASNYVLGVWATIKASASTIWNNLKKAWGASTKWVLDVWAKISTNPETIFQALKDAWGSAKQWILGVWVKISTAISELWQQLVDAWNEFTSGKWLGINIGFGKDKAEQVAIEANNEVQGALNRLGANVMLGMTTVWNMSGIDPISYVGLNNLNTTVDVDMMTPWWYWHKSPIEWMGLNNLVATVNVVANVTNAANAVRAASNFSRAYRKALGGIFSNNKWSDIPQYAGGTSNVRTGSLFWAGENGNSEIVGNAGGRTEVLNKSQIASAIFSAVNAAMAPAAANFAAAAQHMGGSDNTYDEDALSSMIQRAVEAAMSRSNDLDRQKVELLRQISDKDLTVEYSTSAVNKAQTRMNRRAGVTIVPVGT